MKTNQLLVDETKRKDLFCPYEIKTIDREKRTMDVTISTTTQDREGDIVESSGLDFTNFLKNPVVIWCHDLHHPPIGKVLSVRPYKNKADARVEFASTPFALEIFDLFAGGYMHAWSIGFLPKRWERIEPTEKAPGGIHILEAEVVELSAVPVPANPEALSKALDDGKLSLSPDMMKRMISKNYILREGGIVCMEVGEDDWLKAKMPAMDGTIRTPDGLTIHESAFAKSLTETVAAGNVMTRYETVHDKSHAGTEIHFTPIRITEEEIKEAKVTNIVVKVFRPDTKAPGEGTPDEESTSHSAPPSGEEGNPKGDEGTPVQKGHLPDQSAIELQEVQARLARAGLAMSDL